MDLHLRHYRLKAAPTVVDADEGIVEAYVSIFDNVDDVGDRVMPGAFKACIERTGGVWGVVYSHKWGDVPIGKTISAEETDKGLLVRIQLLIADIQAAKEIYAGMKAGVPFEFSFSYDIKASRWIEEDGRDILELVELDVLEVGPCLIGANRETHLVGVKSFDAIAAMAGNDRPSKAGEPNPDPAPEDGADGDAQGDEQTSPQDAEDRGDDVVGLDPLQLADVSRWAAL